MGEGKTQNLQDLWSPCRGHDMKNKDAWMMIKEDEDICRSTTASSSSLASSLHDDSTISNGSSSSSNESDTGDDASSSPTCSSSSNSSGALYDLSELMAQLPIKRGLSKYYQGKSESFTCLSRVTSIEDLAKKEAPYRKKNKGSKSCEGGLDAYKLFTHPKPIIAKKTSRVLFSSSFPRRRGSLINGRSRPPQIPLKKSLNG